MSDRTVESTKHNRPYITIKNAGSMSLSNLTSSLTKPSIKDQEPGDFNDLFLEFLNDQFGTNNNSSGAKGNFNISGSQLDDILNDYRDNDSVFRSIILNIDIYVVPLVSLIGVVGNILSFTVFTCTFMRRLSSSIYLAALSLADLGFLICVLVSWSMNIGLELYSKNGWCQLFLYITYVSSFLSVWYVVSFTSERYIAVHYPLQRQDICTSKRAKIAVMTLAGISFILYSFGIWSSGVTYIPTLKSTICGPKTEFLHFISIVNNVDTFVTLIIPFIAILVMNCRIAVKVIQFYKERKHLALQHAYTSTPSSSRRASVNHNYHVNKSQHSRKLSYTSCQLQQNQYKDLFHPDMNHRTAKAHYTRTQVRVTKMLLLVSSAFLALNLPRHTVRTYSFIMSIMDKNYTPSASHIVWQKLFHFLYYLQFSVNVFLYSAFGKNFRKALFHLGRKIKHKLKECHNSVLRGRSREIIFKATRSEVVMKDYRNMSTIESKYI